MESGIGEDQDETQDETQDKTKTHPSLHTFSGRVSQHDPNNKSYDNLLEENLYNTSININNLIHNHNNISSLHNNNNNSYPPRLDESDSDSDSDPSLSDSDNSDPSLRAARTDISEDSENSLVNSLKPPSNPEALKPFDSIFSNNPIPSRSSSSSTEDPGSLMARLETLEYDLAAKKARENDHQNTIGGAAEASIPSSSSSSAMSADHVDTTRVDKVVQGQEPTSEQGHVRPGQSSRGIGTLTTRDTPAFNLTTGLSDPTGPLSFLSFSSARLQEIQNQVEEEQKMYQTEDTITECLPAPLLANSDKFNLTLAAPERFRT